MSTDNFSLPHNLTAFESAWRAPSNIAIVKYWGKCGVQLPCNPNFSFTLKHCQTFAKVRFTPRERGQKSAELCFEGRPHPQFLPKIELFLERASRLYPWINGLHLSIESKNTFPHSAGLASSASSMAALALCLMHFQREFFGEAAGSEADFFGKASQLARLGSGSACRSMFAPAALWETEREYASPFEDLHSTFRHLNDAILIVSRAEKALSSSAGHAQMGGHPFARARYDQAQKHWELLRPVLAAGDFESFAQICEAEAHSLHALISTGAGGPILWHPQSLALMQEIQRKRKEGLPVCYTLDAGPNVHLLFLQEYRARVLDFVKSTLLPLLPTGNWIDDCVGGRPKLGET